MAIVRNTMGYTSQLPCGDAADDWCSGAEYSSWYETGRAYLPQLTALAESGQVELGLTAGSLIAQFQIYPQRGGTIWEYPATALERPTTRQLAQLVQAMFDLIEQAGEAQPLQVQRNETLPTPDEGLGYLGWGLALGAVGAIVGYYYFRSATR